MMTMDNIVDINFVRAAKEMAWIVCPCESSKWFVMVDDEECADMIRAIRCSICGAQVTLAEPGRLGRKE